MPLIKTEKKAFVALLTINRPEALNALNTPLLEALSEALAAIAEDAGVRAVILTGAGKAFAAGADITEMKDLEPSGALAYAQRGAAVFAQIEALPQPVIAAVNGYALGGGCELAMACDIRIASTRAKFGQPEVGLGITPGFGGTQRLPRLVGPGAAMQIILTGAQVDAGEALRIGLVNAVLPPEALLTAAEDMAEQIASMAPLAVRAAKRAMREGANLPLQDAIAMEGKGFSALFASKDQRAAMTAFVEKRKPEGFAGR